MPVNSRPVTGQEGHNFALRPEFYSRYFQRHFVNIGLDHGLTPNRRWVAIWTNDAWEEMVIWTEPGKHWFYLVLIRSEAIASSNDDAVHWLINVFYAITCYIELRYIDDASFKCGSFTYDICLTCETKVGMSFNMDTQCGAKCRFPYSKGNICVFTYCIP